LRKSAHARRRLRGCIWRGTLMRGSGFRIASTRGAWRLGRRLLLYR